MKKQTAMQMAISHYENLSLKGSNQAYVVAEFLKKEFLPIDQEREAKYQNMLEMLKRIYETETDFGIRTDLEQLIKEAE